MCSGGDLKVDKNSGFSIFFILRFINSIAVPCNNIYKGVLIDFTLMHAFKELIE